VDSAWEQYKLEARKMLVNGDESHLSSARFVRRFFVAPDLLAEKDDKNLTRFYTELNLSALYKEK
jgi:hypothetical protein